MQKTLWVVVQILNSFRHGHSDVLAAFEKQPCAKRDFRLGGERLFSGFMPQVIEEQAGLLVIAVVAVYPSVPTQWNQ